MSAANPERLHGLWATAGHRFELLEVMGGLRFASGFDAFDAIDRIVASGVAAMTVTRSRGIRRPALRGIGITVPGEVGVTGFNDIIFARSASRP